MHPYRIYSGSYCQSWTHVQHSLEYWFGSYGFFLIRYFMDDMLISRLLNVSGAHQANAFSSSMHRSLEKYDTYTGCNSFRSFNVTHILDPSFHSTNIFQPDVDLLNLRCPLLVTMWFSDFRTTITSSILYSTICSMIIVLKPSGYI